MDLAKFASINTQRTLEPVRRRVRSRGVPPALAGHELFYSEEPEEACALLAEAFAPNRLTLGELGATRFSASLHGVRIRDVSLLHLDVHGPATLDIARSGSYFAVHMPMNGRSVGVVGNRPFEANAITAVVTNPGDPLRLSFDHDSPQLIVRVEEDAFERYVNRATGRRLGERLRFEPEFDLTTDAAMRWHGAVQQLHLEIFYGGSLSHANIGIGPLEELVMSSLLVVHPSTHSELVRSPAGKPGRRTVRRALDYIEHHLSEPITMADLSSYTASSIRSIQQGFQEELGVSPMAYARDRRLERAREDLVDAMPADHTTVTSVAERWGFHHLGAFAVLYRSRWGEPPSATLRR